VVDAAGVLGDLFFDSSSILLDIDSVEIKHKEIDELWKSSYSNNVRVYKNYCQLLYCYYVQLISVTQQPNNF